MLKADVSRAMEPMIRQASTDLERRLRAGTGGAEAVLASYPELAVRSETALEVIYTEFVIRQELGETPSLAEFQGRFPEWHKDLAQLFEVHAVVGASDPTSIAPEKSPGDDYPLELLEEIQRGGMGVVYKARQKELNRLVAVKMILSGALAGADELTRFRGEAEAVARLRHPNIVSIFGIGEWPASGSLAPGGDPVPYLTLEFVEGGSLEQKLADGPWPADRAAHMVETLARAMHYAHQQGILHRDLKPANVLLTADGIPKITDFGLAKNIVPAHVDGPTAPTLPAAPSAGTIIGTPSYMAPEQAGANIGPVGPASDVYALGAILYELLTGRPPHRAADPLETLVQVRTTEPIPPRRLQPGLPRDLETICLKCLHKAPERRYGNAEALADDLHRFQTGKPIQARAVGIGEISWRWCRRNPLVAALLLLLLLAMIGGSVGVFLEWRRAEARAEDATRERQRAETQYNKTWDAVERMTRSAEKMIDEPRLSPGALSVINDALVFYEDFLAKADHAPQDQFKMAQACLHVGHIRSWRDERAGAIESYTLASVLFARLHEQAPEKNHFLFDLAASYRALGGIYRRTGDIKEAISALQKAIDYQEQLVARERTNAQYNIKLANYLLNYCAALPPAERNARAEPHLRRAIRLDQDAHKADPNNRWIREELSLGLDDLGMLLWNSKRAREAEELCREAWSIRQQLVNEPDPGHGARYLLSRSHGHLGIIAAGSGRLEEAEGEFVQSVKILDALVKDYQRVAYRKDLIDYSTRLADFFTKAGRFAEAGKAVAHAWESCREDSTALNAYAWFLVTCPDMSLRDPKRALDLASKAAAAEPANGDFQNTLGVARYRTDNLPEARAAFESSMQVRNGGDAYDWFFLAMISHRTGNKANARELLNRASAWATQRAPDNHELKTFQREAELVLGTLAGKD